MVEVLKNDILRVSFDEKKGGMPVRDNFGFLRASAIEIAYTPKPPFFQSLNDKKPRVKKYSSSKLVASGFIQRGGRATSHTYEMVATLDGNRLNLSYKLNVASTERIMRSKIWAWLGQKARVGGACAWTDLYRGKQRPFLLFGGRLEVSGSTTPSVYSRCCMFGDSKYEVVYGWAKGLLRKGTYSGNLILAY